MERGAKHFRHIRVSACGSAADAPTAALDQLLSVTVTAADCRLVNTQVKAASGARLQQRAGRRTCCRTEPFGSALERVQASADCRAEFYFFSSLIKTKRQSQRELATACVKARRGRSFVDVEMELWFLPAAVTRSV